MQWIPSAIFQPLIASCVYSTTFAERACLVQGIAEAAAYREAVASLALVTPPASVSTALRQLAAGRALAHLSIGDEQARA